MSHLIDLLPKQKPVQRSNPDQRAEDQCAHRYLGKLYLTLGQLAEAEAEYLRAHALSPTEECIEVIAVIRTQRA
jgi:tetratricopeptide (TPR) repeat protein